MDTIRHMALGCCVISTVAGMIRVFWPENGFSAVINAVLALYIVAAALQMITGTDWNNLAAEVYRLTETTQQDAQDYTDYGRQIGLSASVEAVHSVLDQAGIEAAVELHGDTCRVELVHEGDRQRAQAVLDASCGSLAYEIVAGGVAP